MGIGEPLQCSAPSCDIDPLQPAHYAAGARQRFFVQFTFDGRPSNPGSRVVAITVSQVHREEGACAVSLNFNTPTAFQFEATCAGKLKGRGWSPAGRRRRRTGRRQLADLQR